MYQISQARISLHPNLSIAAQVGRLEKPGKQLPCDDDDNKDGVGRVVVEEGGAGVRRNHQVPLLGIYNRFMDLTTVPQLLRRDKCLRLFTYLFNPRSHGKPFHVNVMLE